MTAQLLLALSAGLQLRFQPPQVLLQPKSDRKNRVLKEVVAATSVGFETEHRHT